MVQSLTGANQFSVKILRQVREARNECIGIHEFRATKNLANNLNARREAKSLFNFCVRPPQGIKVPIVGLP